MEGAELTNLSRDVLELIRGPDYNALEVQGMMDSLLYGCDADKNGQLDLNELRMLMTSISDWGSERKAFLEALVLK